MDVVGHDHIFVYMNTGNLLTEFYIALHNMSHFRQGHLRGVEVAAPYNVAQHALLTLDTDRNEIRTGGTVTVMG